MICWVCIDCFGEMIIMISLKRASVFMAAREQAFRGVRELVY